MPKEKEKIPLATVKKLPIQSLMRMINKAKKYIKKNEVWIGICKEYDEDPKIIDLIPMRFGDLDVSAKTSKGVITLNYKLLCDGDFFKDFSYLVHEGRHYLDQCLGPKATQSSDDGNYLENKYEQSAFSDQIEYIASEFGEPEAEKYTDDLLEHHEVKSPKKKEELKEVLMEKV